MAEMTSTEFDALLDQWLKTVEAKIGASGKFSYLAGSLLPAEQKIIDAPTELGYTTLTHWYQSVGIQLRVEDPTIATNTPVIDGVSVVKYEIQPDGKIKLTNNFTSTVKYYLKLTMPVKRP